MLRQCLTNGVILITRSLLSKEPKCYICGKRQCLEVHHIFFGVANRKKSDRDGMVVFLCNDCHRGTSSGVHHNKDADIHLKMIAQEIWQRHYNKTKEDFVAVYGKSYL